MKKNYHIADQELEGYTSESNSLVRNNTSYCTVLNKWISKLNDGCDCKNESKCSQLVVNSLYCQFADDARRNCPNTCQSCPTRGNNTNTHTHTHTHYNDGKQTFNKLRCFHAFKLGCNKDEFKCNNERCIDLEWKCDNVDDCYDGSDEVDCGMY